MKRRVYVDGWHEAGDVEFLVENGKLMRGVCDGRTVYPYKLCKSGGLDLYAGVKARYGILHKIYWR